MGSFHFSIPTDFAASGVRSEDWVAAWRRRSLADFSPPSAAESPVERTVRQLRTEAIREIGRTEFRGETDKTSPDKGFPGDFRGKRMFGVANILFLGDPKWPNAVFDGRHSKNRFWSDGWSGGRKKMCDERQERPILGVARHQNHELRVECDPRLNLVSEGVDHVSYG